VPRLRPLLAVTLVAFVCALVSVVAATAARTPTLHERAAITGALPQWLQRYPIGCVYLSISVSSNGRFAKVTPEAFYPAKKSCLAYASNGSYFLKNTSRWRVIFNGSEPPACALAVPRDLVAPMSCRR
jgi:hypothetical protein